MTSKNIKQSLTTTRIIIIKWRKSVGVCFSNYQKKIERSKRKRYNKRCSQKEWMDYTDAFNYLDTFLCTQTSNKNVR